MSDYDTSKPTLNGSPSPWSEGSLATTVIVNGVLPLVTYLLLRQRVPDTTALVGSAIFPILGVGWSWLRSRRLDALGVIVLIAIAASLLTAVLAHNAVFVLLNGPIFAGAFGLAFLISLMLPRPLMFYLASYSMRQSQPEQVTRLDEHWQSDSSARSFFRLMTAVWGLGLMGMAILLFALVFSLPPATFLALSPVVQMGTYGGLILWTMAQGRRRQRAIAEGVGEQTK